MKFPAIPFLTKKKSSDFFLALIFEADKISSILFKEQEKALIVLSASEAKIDLDHADVEDLVVISDKIISKVEISVPNDGNLDKTIFVVPHSWIVEGKIRPERLQQLKKISVELALIPMGFIVSIEAIVAFLQKKEGAPVSGIFVELSDLIVTVYIVRGSNIIDVRQGQVGENVEKTVETLLASVTKLDVLPSKIVLLHTKEAEIVSQKFLSHHWTKELSFMHLPQVVILDTGVESEAIISGVATQLNIEVKGGMVTPGTIESESNIEETVGKNQNDSFGFMKDEDIAKSKIEMPVKDKSTDEAMDFVEDKSVEPIVKHHGVAQLEPAGEEMYEEDEPEVEFKKKSIFAFITPSTFSKVLKIMGGRRNLMIILIAIFAVGLFVYTYYSFILRASVIVFTDQKSVKEDALAISLTTKGESSFKDKTIKISTIDQEVVGEEQQETTGQKATGQKATGTVTIFNKSEGSKKLEKGTTIISSNKLDFTLNDDINIASTSSFATSFSSVQGKVTASSFGKEFNIPSATNFTIKGISASDIFGKNDSAFSGGTKEEIQVVAKKDLQDLENTVVKRLFDKAKSKAKSGLAETDGMIPTYLSYDFSEKKFDKKEDEKSKNIKLDATILYTLGIYKKNELEKFISSSDEFDVPREFKLSDTDFSLSISDIVKKGDKISAKLSFSAVFKPQLDVKQIPLEISGKGEEKALKKLKEISGISDATIVFSLKIPFLPVIMPLRPENIKVELKTQ